MTKIKKIKFFADYTTTPNNWAFTPSINVIGNEVYTHDADFNAYSDSKLLNHIGKMITHSVMYKDSTNKTLTGESTNNISIIMNGDRIVMSKRAQILQEYVDNLDLNKFPVDHYITTTRFKNLSIDNIFINEKKVNIGWSQIKYSQSKKRYTIEWKAIDKDNQ